MRSQSAAKVSAGCRFTCGSRNWPDLPDSFRGCRKIVKFRQLFQTPADEPGIEHFKPFVFYDMEPRGIVTLVLDLPVKVLPTRQKMNVSFDCPNFIIRFFTFD